MPNIPPVAGKPARLRRRIAKSLAAIAIAAVLIATSYAHAWALSRGMANVATVATALGCLSLIILALLSAALRLWAWAFALSWLCISLAILFSFTVLTY